KWLQVDARRNALHSHDQFVFASGEIFVAGAILAAYIAVADALPHGVAVSSARQIADRLAVSQYRFPPEQDDLRVIDCKAGETLLRRLAVGFLERPASEEIRVLAQLHRPAEAGLQRRVIGGDVRSPSPGTPFASKPFQLAVSARAG